MAAIVYWAWCYFEKKKYIFFMQPTLVIEFNILNRYSDNNYFVTRHTDIQAENHAKLDYALHKENCLF